MKHPCLFTIGHSNRTISDFLGLLLQNQIDAVADVRSHPHSGRFPHYSANALAAELKRAGIQYVPLGEELGARRKEPECYQAGQAKYELIAKSPVFQRGMDRVRRGMKTHRIALVCAERDPLECHRSILVCRYLTDECDIFHIVDADTVESHAQAESRLLELVGLPARDLFRSRFELLSEAYDIQGNRIAYKSEAIAAANTAEME
jgi:uncharacterized protein (DUF488 family)